MHVALLLTACYVSAAAQITVHSDNGFQYISTDIRTNSCEMCYDYDCININEARCEYYREVTNVMEEDEYEREESDVTSKVDDMLWEYVDRASSSPSFQYCTPLVSQYTNCHKDNICSGCKVCNCDVTGTWNCTLIENCHTSPSLIIDHRILVKTMENLKLFKTNNFNRKKRSANFKNDMNEYNRTLMWLYGIDSLEESSVETIRTSALEQDNSTAFNITYNMSTIRTPVNINYSNEINKSIYLINEYINKYNRTLNWLYGNDFINDNVATVKHLNVTANIHAAYNQVNNNNLNKLKTSTNFVSEDINKYIGILQWLYGMNSLAGNSTENRWIRLGNITTHLNVARTEDDNASKFKHLVKRSIVLITNETHNNSLNLNTTDDNHNLYNNILMPLNIIISDKEKEINQLINIKQKLIKYLKLDTNITTLNSTINALENKDNSSIKLYQIEIPPELDFRRKNTNVLDKYINKLRRDIREVMRDIAIIQKLSRSSPMSQDMKLLIRAMMNFLRKNKKQKKNIKTRKDANFRRNLDFYYNNNINGVETVYNILELLDKDIPIGDALAPLSPSSRKILERIIQFIYTDDHFDSISIMLDPNNELVDYLNNIGSKWNKMTLDIGTNEISERLYSLKLFVLELSKDIVKISKAIDSLELTQHRRTTIINDVIVERLVSKIGENFKKVNNRVEQIIQFQILKQDKKDKSRKHPKNKNTKQMATKSFIQRIKRILRNPNKDFKVEEELNTVSEPVKESINMRKMNELKKQKLAKYEETMRKWQNSLGNFRSKRNADFKHFMNRMKNIIPGYLRGKVKHGAAKNKNKTKTLREKQKHKGSKLKRTSTTPRVKLSKSKPKHKHQTKLIKNAINNMTLKLY